MMKHLLTVVALLCFTITATYSQICDGPLTVTVEGSTDGIPLDVTGVETQPECNVLSGLLTGSVDLTASGGSPGYTYAWSNSETSEDLSGLGAGTYAVTVTDTKGCTGTAEFIIVEPTPVLVVGTPTDLDCNSGSGTPSGGIDITPSGGQGLVEGDYVYNWSTADGSGLVTTDADQTGLSAGTYDVTVTDANGCTAIGSWSLTEPTPVLVAVATTDLTCNAANGPANGAIDITPSGGQGTVESDYVYNWNTADGSGLITTDADQTGLSAGTYDVTITDDNGCTVEATYTLTEPVIINILASATDLECNSGSGPADGAIDVSVTGGTPGYVYTWSTTDGSGLVAADEDQTGLIAGTYELLVTDANGCTEMASYTLTEPNPVLVAGVTTDLGCNAGSGPANGAIDITASGGQGVAEGDYDYEWSTTDGSGLVTTDADQTGLSAGTYTVIVTDANDCTVTASYDLTEPTPVAVTELLDEPDCNAGSGALDGGIDITASGGTAPYTYNWSGPGTVVADEDQTGLGTGTYDVTITDDNGCTVTASYSLTEPTPVAVTELLDQPDCNVLSGALDGGIDITATGGTGSYVYDWSGTGTVQTDEDQTGLGTGTYDVTITDGNGCTVTASYTLTEPTAVEVAEVLVEPGCNAGSGPANGEINITASGGTAPYTYDWSGTGTVQTDEDQTGLGGGTYDVTITDDNGCTVIASYSLTEPDAVTVAEVLDQPDCNADSGALDGGINITADGGTAPYTYNWSGPGAVVTSSEDQSGLGAGTYEVTVTDDNGCTVGATYVLTEPAAVAVTGAQTDLDCNSGSGIATGGIDITASGGQVAVESDYVYSWSTTNGSGLVTTDADQTGLSAGDYTVLVTDANGCTEEASWTLTEPTAVDVTAVTTDLTCNASNGPANGEIDIIPSGGQGTIDSDYMYNWTTADGSGLNPTDGDQTGLSAGTYDVTVTDGNGCTVTGSYTLTEPAIINILASATDLECNSGSGPADGEIDVTVSGGTPGYVYAWSTTSGSGLVASDEDQTGLTAGTYELLVTDANGCTQAESYTLTEPDPVVIGGTVTPLLCNALSGAPTGAIDITASGGQGTTEGDYDYAWSTTDGSGLVATSADQTGLSAGTYVVVVTDGNDCTETETWVLDEPDAVACTLDSPVVGAGGTNILCAGETGTINVTAAGGTAPYTYSIDGGVTTQPGSSFDVTAGSYTITVYDDNGCESTCDITLTEPAPMIAGTCVVEDECQLNQGEIEVAAEGGVAPYVVTWTSTTGGNLNETTLTITSEGGSVTFTGAEGGETYIFTITDANGCDL